jgi:hypothetical protein
MPLVRIQSATRARLLLGEDDDLPRPLAVPL